MKLLSPCDLWEADCAPGLHTSKEFRGLENERVGANPNLDLVSESTQDRRKDSGYQQKRHLRASD